jgi:hypothetical protein
MAWKSSNIAKKTNSPHLTEHNMVKNDSMITKLNKKFTNTSMFSPANLVSSGKISLGSNHWHGPQAQHHPATNIHTNTTKMLHLILQPASWIKDWVLYMLHPYYIKMEWWLVAITISKSIFIVLLKVNF